MAAKVFNLFFGLLLARLEREHIALSFKMDLLENIMKSKVYSKPIKMIFRQCAITPSTVLMVQDISEHEMRMAIDEAYTVLCEQLGPVAADDCMGAVISDMEQHPDAKQFPIRDFL